MGMVGFAFACVGLLLSPTPLRGFAGSFAGRVIGSLPFVCRPDAIVVDTTAHGPAHRSRYNLDIVSE
jgi:hypothetical protein